MDEVVIIALLAAAGGALVGALAVWLWRRPAQGSVAALEEKHEEFKREVSDHFVKTAELVNDMTHSYKRVYDHLREGARELLDEDQMRERLAGARQPVTLSLLDPEDQADPTPIHDYTPPSDAIVTDPPPGTEQDASEPGAGADEEQTPSPSKELDEPRQP